MQENIQLPQAYKDLVNQVFEIEKKVSLLQENNSISRNITRLKNLLENDLLPTASILYHNPIGEPYNETRTDCDASISGTSTEDLTIIEVIKPIIRVQVEGHTFIVQKALVVVASKS